MIVDIHAHYGSWLSSTRPDTPERFSALLDRFGIDRVIVSSARAILYDAPSGNEQVADLIRRDERVYGAVVVNPNRRDESLEEIDRYGMDKRFVGVKVHPDYCGMPVNAPQMLAVLRKTDALQMPLFVHTWGEAEVEAAASVARAFPSLTVFLFHMGADAWRLAVQRAVEYPNLMLEIIASIPEPRRIRHAVETIGAERVFFGTDMTLLTPAYGFGLVKSARLEPQDREKVLGLNAETYFRFT